MVTESRDSAASCGKQSMCSIVAVLWEGHNCSERDADRLEDLNVWASWFWEGYLRIEVV